MRARIYDLAKELGVENKEIIACLARMGIKVKSHSSSVEEEDASRVRDALRASAPGAKEAQARPAAKRKEEKAPKKAAGAAAKPAVTAKPAAPDAGKPAAKAKTAAEKPPKKAEALRVEKPAPKAKPEAKAKEPAKSPAAPPAPALEAPSGPPLRRVTVPLPASVRKLAEILGAKPEDLIRKLIGYGVMAAINQNLDAETVEIVAHEFGCEAECVTPPAPAEGPPEEEEKDRAARAPVVTFMGHIDHGKTSLLDAIRESSVASGEAGGITQHIGAYEVELKKGRITFLDTPGHETFTAMRARGANVTDIAVLVVAADDGVMPQTREALDHARAANVPIVVAVNKIDKPGAQPDRVRRQLMELGLTPEEYGGQTIFCDVSAITRSGLDHLLEMLVLQAEMMELKASPTSPVRAAVIEARMDKERGAVCTVLVRRGTLRIGDPIVCGLCAGKVKALFNYRGAKVAAAGPATPVEILGLNEVPQPGQELRVVASDKEARKLVEARRLERGTAAGAPAAKMTLEDLFSRIAAGKAKELKLILKGDVQGSVEAMCDALKKLGTDKVSVNILSCAVGDINENDVMLAAASDAVVIGFHTRIDLDAKELSRKESVEIKLYEIIYEALEDVRKAMEGLLEPAIREVIIGRAEVKQLFRAAKGDTVAGSMVTEGKVVENARARLIRGEKIVHESSIASIRRFKDQVREVKAGTDCGLRLVNVKDIQEGDIIEIFRMEKVPQKL